MTANQLHETLKQRILQLNDQDQMEILSNIEVLAYSRNFLIFFTFSCCNFGTCFA